VAVHGHYGTRGQFGKIKGLSADTAPKVEDRGGVPQLTAKAKGSDGTDAVAGTLAGQALVNL